MIIDIHAHAWTDPAAQQRRSAEAGVGTDVLLSTRFHPACTTIAGLTAEFGRLLDGLDGQGVPADPFEHATAEPLAALKDRPGSVGFVNAPLGDPAAAQARVERHLDDPRIRGIGEPTPPGVMRRDRTDPADRIRSRRPARPHGRVRSEHRAGPAHPCGALRPPPARPTHRGGFRRDVLHGADRRGAGAPRPGPGPVERAPGVHGRGSGRGPARPVPVRLQPALRRSGRLAGHGRGGHRRSGHPSPGDGTQRRGRASSAIGVPSATEDPEPQRAPCRQVPCRSTAGLEFERAPRRGVIGTDDETLARALRLAADPPGGISIEALQDLVRDDDPPPPGASAPRQPTGVSPRALRHYERPGLIAVARDRAGRRTCDAAAMRRVVLLARMRTSGAPIAGLRRCVELVDAGSAPWPNVSTCS